MPAIYKNIALELSHFAVQNVLVSQPIISRAFLLYLIKI